MMKLKILKQEEQEAVEEMRARIKSLLSPEDQENDVLLYRFLKARNFDINRAEAMLRKQIIHRKALQLDSILETFTPKEVFIKYYRGSYFGEDKDGYPVRYIHTGKSAPTDIQKCFKSSDYWKHWLWSAEVDMARLKEINKKRDNPVWKYTYICDMIDLDLTYMCHPISARYTRLSGETYQDYYPEFLHKVFVINAPAYFVAIFSLLKKVIAPETVEKFHVYGKSGWKEPLLKAIDADILPAFLGGNRTDPDGNPMCYTLGCNVGKVPNKYYLSEEDMTFKRKSVVKSVKIPPKTTHEISVDVEECGCVIEWEFEIKNKDIGFGLYFKDAENELKEILPMYRYETWFGTHDDSYKCERRGQYVILFDNKYSWLNAKEVSYTIAVIKPQ